MKNFASFYKKIGYTFKKPQLLEVALTHRSMQRNNNERLEFLGDALLNFIIATALFNKFTHATEGHLTRLRAELVRSETLAEIAREFGLGQYLNLGSGELKSGGRNRTSILADATEAIIAAIYLDSDMAQCEQIVLNWYASRIEQTTVSSKKDAKTALQEYLQSRHIPVPTYVVTGISGEQQNQIFHVACHVLGIDFVGSGEGTSRRRAEQKAAQQLLHYLKLE